jgi:multiple sugar transport system substrate-binding protein
MVTRRRFIQALAFSAAGLLAACGAPGSGGGAGPAGGGGGGHVDLTLWHTRTGPIADALNGMIDQFNAGHPTITVKGEYAGSYDDEYKKLLAAAKGGGLPDMAVAYENVVADLMKARIIVPLDPYLGGSDGLSKDSLDDIFPGYIETNRFKQFGNQLLSFPFTKSNLVAYYNADLLSAAGIGELPKTWDDYGAAMRRVGDYARGQGLPFNGGDSLYLDTSDIDFKFLSRGSALVSDDGQKVAFNNPAALAALQFDGDLVKAGASYIPGDSDWQADFANQKTAARLDSSTGGTNLPPIIAKAPRQFRWVAAPPPNDGTHRVTVMYGPNIAIFKSTEAKQAAAWTFIKWFSDTPQTARWALQSHYLPVRKSAAATPEFQQELAANAVARAAFDLLPNALPEPNTAGWQQVRDILRDADTAVVTGKASPKQALDDAEVKANKALADAR